MQATIHNIVRDVWREAAALEISGIPEFVMTRFPGPAQCTRLGLQFLWTHDCQDALNRAKHDKTVMLSTTDKVTAVLSELVTLATRKLSKQERRCIETLITTQVQQKDSMAHGPWNHDSGVSERCVRRSRAQGSERANRL